MKAFSKVIMCVMGIFIAIVGLCFIIRPTISFLNLSFILGVLLLINGIIALIHGFASQRDSSNGTLFILEGTFTIILSIIILLNRGLTDLILPFLFGFWILVSGIISIIRAFPMFNKNAWVAVISIILGLCGVVIGFIALYSPFATALTLGILLGLIFLIEGINISCSAFTTYRVEEVEEKKGE